MTTPDADRRPRAKSEGTRAIALRHCRILALALALLLAGTAGIAARPLPRSEPEAQGVSAAALLEFVTALDAEIEGMHGMMVLRHGQVIAEGWWAPYAAHRNHVLYSLSKSFASTALGFAVAEGRLSIDDEILKFFPEAAPAEPSGNLKAMRVRDILTMATGHQDEPPTSPEKMSARSFLAQPVPHLPGTHFKYNTAATFMQSAIVQQLTGQTALDYLRPRLFEPLGIDYPVWDANFEGISLGGYGLRVRTEDIAKFGQLYLQRGRWDGQQLLPASWINLATSRQVSNGSNPANDWNQGYGFQFWRCRHNAYRGDGAFGQFCVVMPDQDAVIAITSGVKNMQAVLNVIWDKLLPAFQEKRLRADRPAQRRLQEKLAGLKIPCVQGAAAPAQTAQFLNRTFVFPANEEKLESLRLAASPDGTITALEAVQSGKPMQIPCGFGAWKLGRAPFPAGPFAQFHDEPVAGSFAWRDAGTLVVKACAVETPFHLQFEIAFEGDQAKLNWSSNVAFGPTQKPQLIGHAK